MPNTAFIKLKEKYLKTIILGMSNLFPRVYSVNKDYSSSTIWNWYLIPGVIFKKDKGKLVTDMTEMLL